MALMDNIRSNEYKDKILNNLHKIDVQINELLQKVMRILNIMK